VLEIERGASKEEIQRAYRRLVKKYHPDQYQNHPLQKLAEEKMAEINEAYEYLMKNGETSDSYSGGSSGYNSDPDYSFFEQVRIHINNGNLYQAEQMLNQTNIRTAEWHYLMGLIYQKKGWYAQARSHFQAAVNMDPGNGEYRNALNMMNYRNSMYRQRSQGYVSRDVEDLCSICQCLVCTDCCCEAMGSDFITCC